MPSRLPAIGNLLWDTIDRLWVMDWSEYLGSREGTSYSFNVFNREGEWLFRQTLPTEPHLITASGYYSNTFDAEGNPIVHYFTLTAGDTSGLNGSYPGGEH